MHPTLSTRGGVGDHLVLRFALLLSLYLSPFPSLCAQPPAAPVQETPSSSPACSLKAELGEIDDSLTGRSSPLPFFSLFVPKISNPRILRVTSFGNFDRKAFYREIIKSREKSKFNKRKFFMHNIKISWKRSDLII